MLNRATQSRSHSEQVPVQSHRNHPSSSTRQPSAEAASSAHLQHESLATLESSSPGFIFLRQRQAPPIRTREGFGDRVTDIPSRLQMPPAMTLSIVHELPELYLLFAVAGTYSAPYCTVLQPVRTCPVVDVMTCGEFARERHYNIVRKPSSGGSSSSSRLGRLFRVSSSHALRNG
jgi:hypothetical protein